MCALMLTIPLLTAGFGSRSVEAEKAVAAEPQSSRNLTTITFEPSHVRTKEIAEWESLQYGMFIHFGMNTFTQVEESALGDVPPTTYAPTELDVDQWVRVAKEAGMKYVVLTAKHTSGFCLWDSKAQWQGKEYDYDVASSSNKTDVVAEFMKACRKYDIKPGLYYCIMDHHNSFKEVVWETKNGLSSEYFGLVTAHLTELLRNYPGVYEIWVDVPMHLNQEQRNKLYALAKSINPSCIFVFNGWGGRGGAEVPDKAWPADILNSEQQATKGRHYDPWHTKNGKKYYLPEETCHTITPGWFWSPTDEPRTWQNLYKLYSECRWKGVNMLLNVGPDRRGKLPEDWVGRLMSLKRAIDNPALYGATKPLIAFDKGGYGKWISKDAAYEASSSDPQWSGGNEKNLLSGEDYDATFAFHTKEETNPYIVIALKRKALIKGVEIMNRTDIAPERARTLTLWVSNDKKEWKEIWKARGVEDVWTVPLTQPAKGQQGGVEAQYIKIGLQEKSYLHLYSVKVYGEMD